MRVNQNYQKLRDNYLFVEIGRRTSAFLEAHPEADVIRLGIGDVTQPLCPAVVDALKTASEEMGTVAGFHGYGPEQGYAFLREAIRDLYGTRGLSLDASEIFISDGAKSDMGNILDIFDRDNVVLAPDPVYPVYVDTNLMLGRRVIFAGGAEENRFLPLPDPNVRADIIYLCSPNNPTGAVYGREALRGWVDYAREQKALILFDAAYECFIRDNDLPHSIYEIEGARTCAIEFCSLSKTAGFTGTRCGYTVVPHALTYDGTSLNKMWLRRQTTKFNGVPYIIQRGAQAVFTPEGRRQVREITEYYLGNARILAGLLDRLGVFYTGGRHAPYLWLKCPGGRSSWEYFDFLLAKAHVVGTPGAGFGQNGEGFFRLSSFGDRARIQTAAERILAV
ncbi:MAG: LL-diaminopimelate aminotransferase [Oscillospiraceae bacterium]|nr:LL-diaminopimelate aminotransferase [Oscillospiraceae bacterium]